MTLKIHDSADSTLHLAMEVHASSSSITLQSENYLLLHPRAHYEPMNFEKYILGNPA
jgi:hypothetical protein